jgi:hypothetical protein
LERDMASRLPNLAERIASRRQQDANINSTGLSRQTFRLPVERARAKAREILSEFPQGGYASVVEQWRQLPDGEIEFTMRRLRTSD